MYKILIQFFGCISLYWYVIDDAKNCFSKAYWNWITRLNNCYKYERKLYFIVDFCSLQQYSIFMVHHYNNNNIASLLLLYCFFNKHYSVAVPRSIELHKHKSMKIIENIKSADKILKNLLYLLFQCGSAETFIYKWISWTAIDAEH